jgi:uncharacterized protein YbjT (DUF2867 family)
VVLWTAGATGGVGKRVVAKLLQAGKHVRALVRNQEKAQKLLVSPTHSLPPLSFFLS